MGLRLGEWGHLQQPGAGRELSVMATQTQSASDTGSQTSWPCAMWWLPSHYPQTLINSYHPQQSVVSCKFSGGSHSQTWHEDKRGTAIPTILQSEVLSQVWGLSIGVIPRGTWGAGGGKAQHIDDLIPKRVWCEILNIIDHFPIIQCAEVFFYQVFSKCRHLSFIQATANTRQKSAEVMEVPLNVTEVPKMVLLLFIGEYAAGKKDVSELNTKVG